MTSYIKSWHTPLPPGFPPWGPYTTINTNNPKYYDDVLKAGITLASVSPTPTPPPEPSTLSYHTCGVHETSVSGSHSAAVCGTSGHYVCDGSDHSLQASCTHSNPNDPNQTCSVINFYACDGHTHAYPVDNTPNCSNCTDGCSSCPVTCANGHSYDASNVGENNRHRTRTCRWCAQTWQKCVSGAPQCLVKTKRTCWAIE